MCQSYIEQNPRIVDGVEVSGWLVFRKWTISMYGWRRITKTIWILKMEVGVGWGSLGIKTTITLSLKKYFFFLLHSWFKYNV